MDQVHLKSAINSPTPTDAEIRAKRVQGTLFETGQLKGLEGTWEESLSVKCLPRKSEHLRLGLQHPHEKVGMAVHPWSPSSGETETRESWGFLARK